MPLLIDLIISPKVHKRLLNIYCSKPRSFPKAWENKTDITTAINIATKKRLPLLAKELEAKLALIGSSVSHTRVKEAKNRHLGSKALKNELEALASRRFSRLKRSAIENTLSIINEWALREDCVAKVETKFLARAIKEIERNVRQDKNMIKADGGAHLFASPMGAAPNLRKPSHPQQKN